MATNKHHHRNKKEGPLEVVIVAYKIEGHETWRFELTPSLALFENRWTATPHPKITVIKSWKCDRLTGTIQ